VRCRDIDNVLSSDCGDSVPPEAAKHIAECDSCRTLMRFLDEIGKTSLPSEDQLNRIQTGIVENLQPVRPFPSSGVFLFAFVIIFLCVVAVGVRNLGIGGWGALGVEQRMAVFMTLAVSALLLAGSIVRQMVPGSKHLLPPSPLPIAVLSILMLVIAASFRAHEESAFVANGMVCMTNGLTYSIPAGFLFWLLSRRGAMLYPKLVGAAAGGLAGLVGLSVLEVNCTNLNVFHILVWHWGVVLVSSLAGALTGGAVEYIERSRARKTS
jgi:hypothetical protein